MAQHPVFLINRLNYGIKASPMPSDQKGESTMNVSLMSLWLPILLSAVVVFIASSLIWTVVQYHNSDWQKLPDEEAARAALRGTSPGQYSLPHAASAADRNNPEWQGKY